MVGEAEEVKGSKPSRSFQKPSFRFPGLLLGLLSAPEKPAQCWLLGSRNCGRQPGPWTGAGLPHCDLAPVSSLLRSTKGWAALHSGRSAAQTSRDPVTRRPHRCLQPRVSGSQGTRSVGILAVATE